MAAVSSNPPPNPSKKPCKEPYPPISSNINAINIKVIPIKNFANGLTLLIENLTSIISN